jgi:hypothetical protein
LIFIDIYENIMQKTYKKKNIMLKEEEDRNYAASTDHVNATPSEIVNDTKAKHSDANSVTIPSEEIDGNTGSQTATVEVDDTQAGLNTAQKMARDLSGKNMPVNFKVNLNNSKKVDGSLVESVTFTKGELSKFLKSL